MKPILIPISPADMQRHPNNSLRFDSQKRTITYSAWNNLPIYVQWRQDIYDIIEDCLIFEHDYLDNLSGGLDTGKLWKPIKQKNQK